LRVFPAQCDPTSGLAGSEVPEARRFVQAFPNPFARQTNLRFTLLRTGPVTALIHDAAGRLSRRLYEGVLGAGGHELSWDGLDAQGRPAASGIYWVRVAGPDGVRAGRLTLVR
jgi:hypothetical protein